MIWDRGYYSSKDDPHTFTHKAWAAAEIAGIVSIGFAALPMIGGAATAQFGKFLATEKGNSLLGVVGTEFSEVFKKTASEASQFFGTATKEIRSSAYTTLTHQKRARAYRDVLAPLIEGYEAGDHEKFVSKLKGLIPSFSPIIGAVDMQAVEHINPQEYLSALEKKAAKLDIVFQADFKRKQQEIFRNLITAGRDKNATQEEVDHFLKQNHTKVAQSLKDAWTRTVEARERALIKSKNIPGRSLTWGEIKRSKKLQGKMDTYLNTMGYKGGYTSMYNEVMHNIQDLFAETRTQNKNKVHKWNEPIVDELVNLFHSTHSGYSLGADGRIISTAHVSNTARHLLEKGFSHLQLPLIPYKFNVPVRLFKFAQTEHKAVIHLGNLQGQAELSKAFKHSINSVQSHGVALGEHLLIMDPEAESIIDTGHKIATYKSRNSAAIQRMAGLRSLEIENYLDKWGEGYRKNWKPGSGSLNDLQRMAYATSPNWMDLDYDPSVGFIGKPKIQEYSPLYSLTHGKSAALDVTKIHPDQLAHLLRTNTNITPGDRLLALDRIMIERSRSSESIGDFLADNVNVVENVIATSSHYPWKDYRGLLHSVYERAGNAKDLAKAVAGIPDNAGFPGEPFSLLEAATRRADQDRWYSPLHQLNSKLWRAVTSFASEPEQITEASKIKNGFFGELRQEVEGKTGISPMFQKLQEGLLSQWVAEASYTTLENAESSSRHIMAQIQDGIAGSLDSDTVIGKAIARLGLSTEQTKNFLGQVYNGKYVDFNKLNAVLGTLVDPQELLSLTNDPLVKAKIADELRYSVEESMAILGKGYEDRKAKLVTTIAEHAKLLEKIGGKGAWFPQDMSENVLNQPMHFAIPNETPSLGEIFENPLKVLREQYGKGFGLGDYIQSLVDPNHPLGQFSMATTILMQMPQEIANNIGIGLGQQDRITAARSLLGFYGKRVAPLVGAYAAYQGLNHLAHQSDMPGVDDIGANILANANLAGATVKDALGITKINKYLVGLLPGLDQYFHPRSHDEYEDYLFYGDEEVRSGRGWVIGTRGSIHGGKVKYVRPNFYRRWKSHWTEVDNSFSYSPHNPYVQHAQHRKELNNLRDENYLEINSQGQYGELGYGTFGYGLPIQTSGGGTPVLFGEVGGYPGGAGSTGPGGAHPGGLPLRLNYFHGHSEGSMSLQNIITGASDIFRRQFGLYGTLLQRVPFFPTEYDSTARQNPNADHNIIRRMFAGDYGEATGPLGEFLRRFVNYRQQPYDAPSNLINDMPSWLPDRFKCITYDTLVEVDGNSFKKAIDLKIGDTIRTHKGNLSPLTSLVLRKMDSGEKLYKIKTTGKQHFTAKLSEEHPLWTPTGWKEIKNINIGDFVGYPIPKIEELVEKESIVDISKYVERFSVTKDYIYPYKTREALYKLVEYMMANDIDYWEKGQCKEVCSTLGIEWDKCLGAKARQSKNSQLQKVSRFVDINSPEWGIFIGYFVAEGSVRGRNIVFGFHEDENSFIEELDQAMFNLWGLRGKIYQYEYCGHGKVVVYSSAIIADFLKNFLVQGPYKKKLVCGVDNWKIALRTFFNGDGCYTIYKNTPHVAAKQPHNMELLYKIWQFALANNIVGSLSKEGISFNSTQAYKFSELIKFDKAGTSQLGKKLNENKWSGHWYFEDGYFYCKLTEKEEVEQEPLVAISIDGDNSFCLPGLATHNTGNAMLRTPAGEHNLPGEAWEREHPYDEPLRVRGSNIGLTEKEIIQKWLNPMQPLEGDSAEDIVNFGCVDIETEILTENGWKKYGEFKVGDKILTLNHDTGLSEWHPVDHINSYSVADEKLVSLESKWHSSLTTKNHKWPILRTYYNNNVFSRETREWSTSEEIGKRNQAIILGAKCGEIPSVRTYSDDFVKLVAWYWTEGSLHGKRAVFIHQSKKVNMPYVLEIRQILTNLFGPESSNMHSNYSSNPPMWREYSTKTDFATFALNVPASEELLKVVPNKIASTDFIKKLTEEQLNIFIETSIKADGKCANQIGQKEEEALEAIELACILLGKRTNLRLGSPWIYRYKGKERICNECILGFHSQSKYAFHKPSENRKTEVEYTGIVWCPTVKNSTWCARRKGKVFYTGNSEAHLKIQRQLRDQGILVGAEVSIFDKEHNISGTIDAIVRGPTGNEIFDIKTQGAKSWGHTPDKYIDQITAYMAITGLKMAHLAFVNRDDMSQVRIEDYPFDPHRWQNILDKVDRARAVMNKLVAQGTVSKYETYDLLSRIEILARVAPKSQEFRDAVQFAEESGGFGGFEKQRFQVALRTAGKLSEDYNLYPNRYSPKLETHSAMILGVNGDGSVTTDIGTFKMAGIKWDNQAFAIKDPETIMKEYGIVVGKKHKMTLLEGQWNPELTNDANLPAIFGSANARLINSDYADRDSEARDPLSGRVLFGEPIFGKIAENLLHRDNMFCIDENTFVQTKFKIKKASEIEIGDEVLTHTGEYKKVLDTRIGKPTNQVYKIMTHGSNIPFYITGNHQVLAANKTVRKTVRIKRKLENHCIPPDSIEFRNVEKLTLGDYLVYKSRNLPNIVPPEVSILDLDPKFKNNDKGIYSGNNIHLRTQKIVITRELARLMGYYAAEGSLKYGRDNKPRGIELGFHIKEVDYHNDVINIANTLGLHVQTKTKGNGIVFGIADIVLSTFVEKYFGTKGNKIAPDEILANKELRAEFIRGLFRGDAVKRRYAYTDITLKAKELITWTRDCLFDLWKIPSNISTFYVGEREYLTLNLGYSEELEEFINCNDEYIEKDFKYAMGKGNNCWRRRVLDGFSLLQIKSIEKVEIENQVVDIEVEDNHTFSTLQYTIHNSNKFLRVRTATEQLERSEAFGSDETSWAHMWDTFGGPTLSAIASKNPFEGALMGAAIAGMFITGSKEYKKWAGIAGAVAGGSLATLKSFYDLVHHDEWVPSRVKKRRMHDEYWDLIKFVKFSTIANAAKKKAKRLEGVDIDQLEDAEKRTTVGLGPWAILALNAEKKAMGTMYAFDPDSGSLDEALSAIPDRHKQLARSVILNGSRREKERFYSLLSNPEKRTLGKFIGVDERDLPIRPRMSKYFQKHFLPGPFWQGWDPSVELDDIEDRAAEMEGQKIDRPSRARTERARDHTKNVMIPRMDRGTGFLIGGRLEAITALAGKNLRVKYDIKASDTNVVNVNMHLFEDQTDQLIAEMKKDAWSS